MKKIFLILCIGLSSIPFFNGVNLLHLNPDTIITNNNTINYYDTINNINNEVNEDSFNYIFKKREILNNISEFKNVYISTINNYISNEEYLLASNYLNEYLYLFSDNTQVLALKDYLDHISIQDNLVEYSGEIEVLSFNPIIAYSKAVLDKKNSSASMVDENNITCDEFQKILLSLYEKNYVLISSDLLSNYANKQKLMLPKHKKPLILILEDVEYNTKNNGSVEKLILDNNEQIATYTPKRSINDRIRHDNDFITILESFVSTRPTFSFNGAKATIVIDGAKGIFGYNTQKSNATSKYQIKKAMEIINWLKVKGYNFISEGYGADFQSEPINFANALNQWKQNIEPIVDSKTNIFFLNTSLKNHEEHNENLTLLKSYNYNILIGLEMLHNAKNIDSAFYLTAKQINGKTLRYCQDNLSHLFDCEYVYDHINRHITFNI